MHQAGHYISKRGQQGLDKKSFTESTNLNLKNSLIIHKIEEKLK